MSYLTDEDCAAIGLASTIAPGDLLGTFERIVRRHRAEALHDVAELGVANGYLGELEADWIDELLDGSDREPQLLSGLTPGLVPQREPDRHAGHSAPKRTADDPLHRRVHEPSHPAESTDPGPLHQRPGRRHPMTTVTLKVPGIPKPKGSLKCIGGRGRIRHQLIEDHRPGQAEWRERITHAAGRTTTRATAGDPVIIQLHFVLPRPAGHYGTGHNARQLKARRRDARATSRRTGDIDKLTRLVLDALTDGGLLADDSQVIRLEVGKEYVDHPRALLPWPGVLIGAYLPDHQPDPQPSKEGGDRACPT